MPIENIKTPLTNSLETNLPIKINEMFGPKIGDAIKVTLEKPEYSNFTKNEKLISWVLDRVKEDLIQEKKEGQNKISPESLKQIIEDRMADAMSNIKNFQEEADLLTTELAKYDFSGKEELVRKILTTCQQANFTKIAFAATQIANKPSSN